MSIYLMRRLPDPREYARRCWTLPLIGVGICLVLTAVTTAVCYLIYMKCTAGILSGAGTVDAAFGAR